MTDITISFYKTNNPDVVAAVNDYFDEKTKLFEDGKAFKEKFGAEKALFCSSFPEGYLGGLVFSPKKDTVHWTKPDEHGIQRPRAIKGFKASDKPQQQQLIDDWNAAVPKQRVSLHAILESCGLNWGDFIFGGHFSIFQREGFAYVKTSHKPAEFLTEILASEFTAAHEAQNAEVA